ncbi:MAG TPA: hypothetical protein ENJ88_07130 [Phaeodactylibacter sp.]|nr:hypothetical protein [Phaeodactylibacter sp.]
MKLTKAQKILKKINALLQSTENNGEKLLPMERDLMLNYLRQLYDIFLHAEVSSESQGMLFSSPAEEQRPQKDKPLRTTTPEPAPEKKAAKLKESPKPEPEPQPEPEPEPQPEPEPEPQPEPQPKTATTPHKAQNSPMSEELQELFELPVAKELSEKLSALPVNDLSKAMGLNEKIFTIKELFGDEQELFNKTIDQLNKLSSFDEAKLILAQIAQRFAWTDKKKKKKAKNFIKLVSRRYK